MGQDLGLQVATAINFGRNKGNSATVWEATVANSFFATVPQPEELQAPENLPFLRKFLIFSDF